MKKRTGPRIRVALKEFRTFSWPVKIRVEANITPVAPRQSPIFPASSPYPMQPVQVLRTIGLLRSRPSRRANTAVLWQTPDVAEASIGK
jgi:hypothetical protein